MLAVGDRMVNDPCDLVAAKGLQLEDPATADQSAGEREEGVLGGGPDQRDHTILHIGQEHVLLGLVEAVDLVDEKTGSLAVVFQPPAGRLEHVAHILHARRRRREFHKPPLRLLGDDLGERRLAHAWRAVEDHRAEPVGLDQPPQEFSGADHLLLADILCQPPRSHPRRQRGRPRHVGCPRGRKKIGQVRSHFPGMSRAADSTTAPCASRMASVTAASGFCPSTGSCQSISIVPKLVPW